MRRPWVSCSRPSSSFSSPAMTRSSDDLPAPLRPMRPSRSPASSESAAWSSSATWPKARCAPESERTAMRNENRAGSGERGFEGVDEGPRHVEAGLLADLLEAGRAGDVDFGEAVADDVDADEQQAALRQDRADV